MSLTTTQEEELAKAAAAGIAQAQELAKVQTELEQLKIKAAAELEQKNSTIALHEATILSHISVAEHHEQTRKSMADGLKELASAQDRLSESSNNSKLLTEKLAQAAEVSRVQEETNRKQIFLDLNMK